MGENPISLYRGRWSPRRYPFKPRQLAGFVYVEYMCIIETQLN